MLHLNISYGQQEYPNRFVRRKYEKEKLSFKFNLTLLSFVANKAAKPLHMDWVNCEPNYPLLFLLYYNLPSVDMQTTSVFFVFQLLKVGTNFLIFDIHQTNGIGAWSTA